jgi:death-on-curing protein
VDVDPAFLDEETVVEIHDRQIRIFTPSEDSGIGDVSGLRSAIASARQVVNFEKHATLFDVAATYAYNISMRQAFINGNKRTGLQCALVFLDGNGYSVESDEKALFEKMAEMHAGPEKKTEFAEFLRKCSVRKGGLTEWIRRMLSR